MKAGLIEIKVLVLLIGLYTIILMEQEIAQVLDFQWYSPLPGLRGCAVAVYLYMSKTNPPPKACGIMTFNLDVPNGLVKHKGSRIISIRRGQ